MQCAQSLAARLREETAELFALLPAARRAAAGGPAGGEAALDGIARAAYRILRLAENADALAQLDAQAAQPVPVCVSALAAAFLGGAAGVCRAARFVPAWPDGPLWAPGHERLFLLALGELVAGAVRCGGERPVVHFSAVRSGENALLSVTRPDGAPDAPLARRYAAWCGGHLVSARTPAGGGASALCLPLCAPGTCVPPDLLADRFSPLYVQLAGVCDLPL